MARYLMIVAALICTGSTAAFLYYVPAIPVLAVALVLIGLVLMFLFGVQVGASGKILVRREQITLAHPAETGERRAA